MQFMPATWDETMGHGADPYNPELSIEAGCKYLRRLMDFFSGDTVAALAAYNHGMGNVRNHLAKYGKIVDEYLPAETRNYIARIAKKRGEIEGVIAHA
jgi:soluble lytic murein transglycosylase-like protein